MEVEEPAVRASKGTTITPVLQTALNSAQSRDIAQPSARACAMASALLVRMAPSLTGADELDVFVCDDGTIEVTAFPGARQLTIDFSPDGSAIQLVVQNAESGEVLESRAGASEAEVIKWLERAA